MYSLRRAAVIQDKSRFSIACWPCCYPTSCLKISVLAPVSGAGTNDRLRRPVPLRLLVYHSQNRHTIHIARIFHWFFHPVLSLVPNMAFFPDRQAHLSYVYAGSGRPETMLYRGVPFYRTEHDSRPGIQRHSIWILLPPRSTGC